jgi:hypothetical protein
LAGFRFAPHYSQLLLTAYGGVMLHRKFFVLFWLFTLIGVAGCYRITYEPYGTTYFTIKNGGKKTVLSVLDEYSAINGFIRTQEGSESLNEEYKAVVMNAAYKNQNDISYRVMNLLNHECFGLHAYDYSKIIPTRQLE